MSQTSPPALPANETLVQRLVTGVPGAVVLIALVLICYNKTLTFEYIWDDDAYVVNNTNLDDMDGLSRIWTQVGATPQYYPMTFTSFWIERQIFGTSTKAAAASHLVNLLLHACNAVLLWTILRRLRIPGAWLAAALFAVHPINVESVAWVAERKNVLSLALALSALLVYLRYAGLVAVEAPVPSARPEADEGLKVALPSEPGRLYLLFIGLFAAALLAKTTVAVLPAVILVIIWWKRGTWTRRDLLPLAFPLVLAAAAGMLTSYVERNPYLVGATGPDWSLSPPQRAALAGQTTWFYVPRVLLPHPFVLSDTSSLADSDKLPMVIENAPAWLRKIAPMPLMFNYPKWTVDASNPLQWRGLAAVIAVAGVLVIFRRKIGRGALACVVVYIVCLLPASGLFDFFPMQFSWVADHFVYLASIPLLLLVSSAAAMLWARLPLDRRDAIGVSSAVLVIGALLVVSTAHMETFRKPQQLWQMTLVRNPGSWLAASNLGVWWQGQAHQYLPQAMMAGSTSDSAKRMATNLDRAERWLQYAQKRNPDSYQVYHWQALLAAERGDTDAAIRLAQKSDEVAQKKQSKTWIYPRIFIADLLLKRGEIDKARRIYEELQPLEPKFSARLPRTFAGARLALARLELAKLSGPVQVSMSQADRDATSAAIEQLNAAIDLAPNWSVPKIEMARLLVETPSLPMGLQLLNEVIMRDKDNVDAKYVIALAALKQNEPVAAGAQLANLLQGAPGYLSAYVKLAETLVLLDRRPEAIQQLEICLRRDPNFQPAIELLAKLRGATTQPTTFPSTIPALWPTSLPAF
ncbi:MAG: hypothetical protein H7144_10430 [Burkholderiales bacterium]|nr:hypothetical protein [Phycisphaerae bacterium]